MRLSHKAQSLLEYALVTVLVIAGIITSGPYVVRAINSHFKSLEDGAEDSFNEKFSQANPTGVGLPGCNCAPLHRTTCGTGNECDRTQEIWRINNCNPIGCEIEMERQGIRIAECRDDIAAEPGLGNPEPEAQGWCCTEPDINPTGVAPPCDANTTFDPASNSCVRCGVQAINAPGGRCPDGQMEQVMECGQDRHQVILCHPEPACAFMCTPPGGMSANSRLCNDSAGIPDNQRLPRSMPYLHVTQGGCTDARKCEAECNRFTFPSPTGTTCNPCPSSRQEHDEGCLCTCRGETSGGRCASTRQLLTTVAPCLQANTTAEAGWCGATGKRLNDVGRISTYSAKAVPLPPAPSAFTNWQCVSQVCNSDGGCRTCHQSDYHAWAFCLPPIDGCARPVMTDFVLRVSVANNQRPPACPGGYVEMMEPDGMVLNPITGGQLRRFQNYRFCVQYSNVTAVRGNTDCPANTRITVNGNFFVGMNNGGCGGSIARAEPPRPNGLNDVCPQVRADVQGRYRWSNLWTSWIWNFCAAEELRFSCPPGGATTRCPRTVSVITELRFVAGANCPAPLVRLGFLSWVENTSICGQRLNICAE